MGAGLREFAGLEEAVGAVEEGCGLGRGNEVEDGPGGVVAV